MVGSPRSAAQPSTRATRRLRGVALAVALSAVVLLVAVLVVRTQPPTALRSAITLRYPDTHWVDTATLARELAQPSTRPVLLDVRTRAEYDVSHLEGARHVAPTSADLEALHLDSRTPIVVYCAVGLRSAALASRLTEQRLHSVRNLSGGIFQWANEGRPLFRGALRVTRVHPYDRFWAGFVRRELRSVD